jgi:hypothetical protein
MGPATRLYSPLAYKLRYTMHIVPMQFDVVNAFWAIDEPVYHHSIEKMMVTGRLM